MKQVRKKVKIEFSTAYFGGNFIRADDQMKISIKQLNIRKQNNRPNVWRRSRVWQNSGCGFLGRKNGESLECLQNPLEVGRRKIGEIRRKEIGKFQYNKGIGEDIIDLHLFRLSP